MSLKIVSHWIPDWGTIYSPPGDGPFPAVLLLHGSEGAFAGWSHLTAALLAAEGFLAFPSGYSTGGNPWNAGEIIDVPLDRTVEAIAALRAFPLSGGKVGLYGVSRGGEHALLATALMARDGLPGLPDAVAVHAAADVVCGAFDGKVWRDPGDPGWRSWDPGQRAWTWRGSSETLLPTSPIEIERYAGPLFLSHGTDDDVWSVDMTRRLESRLLAAGRKPEVHYYEGEGHLPGSAGENVHNERLVAFLKRHLTSRCSLEQNSTIAYI